jgi:uncharacterized membrane protein
MNDIQFLLMIVILAMLYYVGKFFVYFILIKSLTKSDFKESLVLTFLVIIGKKYLDDITKRNENE